MKEINSYIEHTILGINTKREDIECYCRDAIKHGFSGVCIPPYFVKEVTSQLSENDKLHINTVIGFPMGYSYTVAKVEEIKRAKDSGAHGVEIMANMSAVLDGNWAFVTNDIHSTVTTARLKDMLSKIIIDTSTIKSKELQKLCEICIEAGAQYIIAHTSNEGASVDIQSIKMLKRFVKDQIKIQVSGGIHTQQQILDLIDAGATKVSTDNNLFLLHL